MRIVLLEPYYTGSHAAWVDGYVAASRHQVIPLTLKGQFWKWRMHGGAVTLARRFREQGLQADLILATDMLDLTTFLALTRDRTSHLPAALYLHENQLTYPLPPGERRDVHYGFINYASALVADAVFFNSAFHLESFFDELPRLLKHFPDHNELATVHSLMHKSHVLPLGLDLARFDAHRPTGVSDDLAPPLLLWNHRWEYDKNPAQFFEALFALQSEGLDFRVALLGEHFVRVPPEFEHVQARLGERIVRFGYAEDFSTYARWLWQADIVVSSAIHDFFGAAVIEALYCHCFPVLPHRLTYPALVPPAHHGRCLYRNADELVTLLRQAVTDIAPVRQFSLRRQVARYDWSTMAGTYDAALETVQFSGATVRR
ncbi:MAG: tRNA-queuosine alpha-mannosyltransferase domain-containing protein [Chloroflexota bacterium]